MTLDKAALGAIRSGLGISYAGFCVMAAVVIVTILLAFGMDLPPQALKDVPRFVRVLIAGLSISLLLGGLIDLLGRIRCLAVPPDFFGRPALTGSITLLLVGLTPFVWRAISAAANLPPMPIPLHRGLEFALVASPLLFLSFLRDAARDIDRPDHAERLGLAQSAGIALVLAFVLLRVLDLVLDLADPISVNSLIPLNLIGYILIEIGALITFVIYSNSLVQLRAAILQAMNPDVDSATDTLWSAPPVNIVIPSVRGPLDLDAGLPPSHPKDPHNP